jgi:hypothetical protein
LSKVVVRNSGGHAIASWGCKSYQSAIESVVTIIATDAANNVIFTEPISMLSGQEEYSISNLPAATANVTATLTFPDLQVTKQVPVDQYLGNDAVVAHYSAAGTVLHNYSTIVQQVKLLTTQGALVDQHDVSPGVFTIPHSLAKGNYIVQCDANKQGQLITCN